MELKGPFLFLDLSFDVSEAAAVFLIGSGMVSWLKSGAFLVALHSTSQLSEVVWSAIGGDENADPSWDQSLWMSWGLFFDPGTQTGGIDPVNPQGDSQVT